MNFNAFKVLGLGVTIAALSLTSLANAAGKTYTEDEFITKFSGKSKKVVMETLGKPVKTSLPVKPASAEKITGKNFDDKKSKRVKIEMWYYNDVVRYDPKRTYKEIELTFVNDRVGNIGFFNNR